VTASPIPPTAVVRVSRGNFDPVRFAEVHETTIATVSYLVPAVKELPGLISYHAGRRPTVPWCMSASGSPTNTHSR